MNKKIIETIFGKKTIEDIENNICPCCGEEIESVEFRDRLSIEEYKISGMCQKCQDKVFGED